MSSFFSRHQPQPSARAAIIAGVGGAIGIAALALLTDLTTIALLMAPFGASCVLLFSVAASPLSQPINVIGGHLVAALIGLIMHAILPDAWWAVGIAVGIAIGMMAILRVTHPPAGANPIVIFAISPGFDFIIFPVLIGACALVLIATAYHRATATVYPLKKI